MPDELNWTRASTLSRQTRKRKLDEATVEERFKKLEAAEKETAEQVCISKSTLHVETFFLARTRARGRREARGE